MRAHEKPDFVLDFDVETEKQRIEDHLLLDDRRIPPATENNLLIATWNLTNFGLQEREDDHLELMAHIMAPFDLVAFQEVADDINHLDKLMGYLEDSWNVVFTDIAGNQERLGYIYKVDRVQPMSLVAELAMRGYERARIEIEGIDPQAEPFTGFNRNPYMAGFRAGDFTFTLVNVHLYWSNVALRRLETKALAKWAESRLNKSGPPNDDIILIGDFNMPHARPGDVIFDELANYGITLPKHTTHLVGTDLAGDNDYDEVAFFPSRTNEDFSGRMGVFDFDNAIFQKLWTSSAGDRHQPFFKYVRYFIADHRPLWVEFNRNVHL